MSGNKDRIAEFNRKAKTLSFADASSEATWFSEYPVSGSTKIPHLLWSLGPHGHILSMKTLDGSVKPLVQDINTRQQDKLMTARDYAGRVYVLYHDSMPAAALHLERFSADGEKDESFGTAKSGFAFPDTAINGIAVDFKTADVFLLKRTGTTDTKITAYMAKADDNYAHFSAGKTVTISDSSNSGGVTTIDAAAAFDGTLFFAMYVEEGTPVVTHRKLYACQMKTDTVANFELTGIKDAKVIAELRADPKFSMTCTGLFADKQGVYGLLAQQRTVGGASLYALGKIVRYTYDGTHLKKDEALKDNNNGLNPDASAAGSLKYDAKYLSYPVGFLGYDGDALYIADDGVNIEEVNENIHINGNKDRIVAFDRKNNTLDTSSVSLDNATWFAKHDEYKYPDTKVLLWKNSGSRMDYWISTDGTEQASADNKLDFGMAAQDAFCYDQDGNLYIVWHVGSDYKVERFMWLREGNSYAGQGVGLSLAIHPVSAIAVDISDGQNILYYVYADSSGGHIGKCSWDLIDSFDQAVVVPGYDLTFDVNNTSVTALAANKDGVFVGIREVFVDTSGIERYRLKVRKYKKTDGTADGEIILVDNAAQYTNEADEAITHAVAASATSYIEYAEAINNLQVVKGMLYAITSKTMKGVKKNSSGDECPDSFKHSSVLYKIGKTAATISSGNVVALVTKDAVDSTSENPNEGISYNFYRFIAVTPKKLVIASDGAWGKDGIGMHPAEANNNKVFEYDLDKNLLKEKGNAGGKFSKELSPTLSCGFAWK